MQLRACHYDEDSDVMTAVGVVKQHLLAGAVRKIRDVTRISRLVLG